ncbi:MAG: hypothetical protein ACRDD7_16325 [Peptostreptococcaceae bacterium]
MSKWLKKLFQRLFGKKKVEIEPFKKSDYIEDDLILDYEEDEKEVEKTENVLAIEQKQKLFHEGNRYVFTSKNFQRTLKIKVNKKIESKCNGREVVFADGYPTGIITIRRTTFLVHRSWCKCIENNLARRS